GAPAGPRAPDPLRAPPAAPAQVLNPAGGRETMGYSRAMGPVGRAAIRRRPLLALTAGLAGGALAACSVGPFRSPPADQALNTWLYPFETLDPMMTQGSLEAEYVVHIFSGLTGLNEKLEVVPDLAERWQVSQDGTVYTFSLRRGARFQDGREVKAAD